ncbi:amino acid transporter [Microthyrium microscopicum]|uniref:Amino acid transporter n=1 Tax=Microthyrium microscopicum TaxID=703497 RepID=A0A6A6U7E0_9PEZI|nr:amino acid transporter [Microthyrium microscopicum]
MSSRTEPDGGVERPLLADPQDQDYGTQGINGNQNELEPVANHGTFIRNLGTLEAFAIIISIVIGSGIFTSPGSIDSNVPSPGIALIVWLVGGVLAWTGAATLAELGTAIPGEGGVQPYLRYIFGDVFGFLAAWTWIVAVMPATLAILSIVFIESIFTASGVTDQADRIEHKLLSVLVLIIINGINSISTKVSTQLNNFFVVTKFVTIAAVVIAGIAVIIFQSLNPNRDDLGGRDWFIRNWLSYRDSLNPDGSETHWKKLNEWETLGHLSTALYGSLWAYSGWDKAIYISAEMSHPARQLPLSINTAIPTIIGSFLAINVAYYVLLPWDVVSTTDSVAVTAITRLLGFGFGIVAAILICLVVAGSLLGNSFVASRMAVAAANMGWFPQFFAIVGHVGIKPAASDSFEGSGDQENEASKSDAPRNALLLSTVISALYILLGNFRALLTFNGLGEYTFFLLTVLGALVLRYREPDLARPYKTFILIPVIFALVSGFVVIRGALFAPLQAAILIIVWIVGLAVYLLRKRLAGSRQT